MSRELLRVAAVWWQEGPRSEEAEIGASGNILPSITITTLFVMLTLPEVITFSSVHIAMQSHSDLDLFGPVSVHGLPDSEH